MTKNIGPAQEPLFPPDNPPMPGDQLTDEQSADYDRLDAQGQLSAGQILAEIGAVALPVEKPTSATSVEEEQPPRLHGPARKPRPIKGFSAKELRMADRKAETFGTQ